MSHQNFDKKFNSFSESTLALNITSSSEPKPHSANHHKCYVCLPPDKSSAEAQEILSLFRKEKEKLKDCLAFSGGNKTEFEFRCSGEYRGCLMRINGELIYFIFTFSC
jgi:hypothetical protein